ncbi:hypothetical protein OIV83_005263 [Microbotryomycetes sp. JL201]|nr:hypothetical protein OIV83_005263 [Microbotryomycetes sp. JL201]
MSAAPRPDTASSTAGSSPAAASAFKEARQRPSDVEVGVLASPGGLLDGVGPVSLSVPSRDSLGKDTTDVIEKNTDNTDLNDVAAQLVAGDGFDDGCSNQKAAADEFPEGTFQGWLCVLGAWSISAVSWGLVNSFSVFQAYYKQHQLADKSPDVISWIGSTQICLVSLGAVFVGRLFDAGFFSLPHCSSFGQIFAAQGLAMGAAPGIAFLPAVSSISHWFKRRRAFVLGIFATGASIGGICYPLLLNKLLYSGIGFGWTVRIAGFLTLALLLVAIVFVKQRLPPRTGKGHFVDYRVFKDPAYSFIVAGAAIVMMGLYIPFTFLQTYAQAENLDRFVTLYGAAILSAGSVFGRLIPPFLADSFGPIFVLAFNTVLTGILIFLWIPLGRSTAGLTAFCIMFGFTSGTQVSMAPACIASITASMNEIGVRLAMCYLAIALSSIPGPPVAGVLIDRTGGYVASACFGGACVLVGAVCYMTSLTIVAKRKGKWQV